MPRRDKIIRSVKKLTSERPPPIKTETEMTHFTFCEKGVFFFCMPHRRARHLEALLRKSLGFSQITGIFGHRQVGKTTLANILSPHYQTLDLPDTQARAQADPLTFLATSLTSTTLSSGERALSAPLVIDECQLAPALFPALKEWVRTRKQPGQFLLTGSVRFSSRKAIRESLTGRIVTWELLPMDWAEIHGRPLADSVLRGIASKTARTEFGSTSDFSPRMYAQFLETGGLPGVFAVRDPAIRSQRFETQLNTILERDLRLIIETPLSYGTLREIAVALAQQAGSGYAAADLQRKTRVSLPTLRKLIPALEALFFIRLVPSEGDYRKPTIFFEDIGEQNHLLGAQYSATDPMVFLAFLFQQLRTQLHYRPQEKGQIFVYRDRKSEISTLALRTSQGLLGVFPATTADRIPREHEAARRFLAHYSRENAAAWIVTVEDADQWLSPRIRWLGAGRIL